MELMDFLAKPMSEWSLLDEFCFTVAVLGLMMAGSIAYFWVVDFINWIKNRF